MSTKNGQARVWAVRYARIALGAAFLSAVAARFGLWHGTFDLAYFGKLIDYTAQVNSFLPKAMVPALAITATVFETLFGLALLVGFKTRYAAIGSAILLFFFATAMAISFGIKEPMDYSVYSASACACLLALSCTSDD
jgi:uncharacterized membrane protein YphA (DoxX/SURF4 family)